MTAKTDNQIKLASGRTLGYAEYGDPHGKPVLHFHGLPSSRFELNSPGTEEAAARLHARIILVERPGIGLSDYQPYRIVGWPDLVTEFADLLQLERFAVMGYSSGTKYVAACAWKIPQRLSAAAIVSGNCPYDLPGARASLGSQDRLLYLLADKFPWLLRLILGKIAGEARKDPASVLKLSSEVSEPDKAAIAQPDIQELSGNMVLGAFAQGTRGAALDWKLEARPWGFRLEDISMPVHVFHGEQDKIVPVEQGRIMAKALPNARATFYPGEGHISLMGNHYEELLGALVG